MITGEVWCIKIGKSEAENRLSSIYLSKKQALCYKINNVNVNRIIKSRLAFYRIFADSPLSIHDSAVKSKSLFNIA